MARILVVEDDEWSRRIVVDLLEMRGHDVIEALDYTSAREGFALGPELVLLDIQFPGGNGVDLLREMRATHRVLPILALTASAMSGDRERFLEQGFTAYLSKPIDVKTFCATVEGFLVGGAS